MNIHHVNCATMCPLAPDVLVGGEFVCHCLIIETDDSGLVLVDTGLGTDDVDGQLPWMFRATMRPALDRRETAVERVKALGYDPEDVRHVIVTHLDADHAGGLPDFPNASVHLHTREKESIAQPPPLLKRTRRLDAHWAHGPDWHTYTPDGESWFGFDAVRSLDGLPPEILLIPLFGHTAGHSGVAVKGDDGWLLHAGDAYFSHAELVDGDYPPLIRTFQSFLDVDREARVRNQQRLAELRAAEDDVEIFCAHDPDEFPGGHSSVGAPLDGAGQ